ncbi:MAG: hypothetical protein ACI9YL_002289 [Luteibaculaceae bacterium]|jgi:hypothetical protein
MLRLNNIENKIGPGEIFFISDFAEASNYEATRKALQRLTKDGVIERLAKGIYFLPKKHAQFGTIYPHAEKIAKAIAKRDKARIIATGSTALNQLGLSTQIPLKHVFLTDGSTRNIKIGKQSILFKKTNPKNLSIHNSLANLIVQALKTIGEQNVSSKQLDEIHTIIRESGEVKHVFEELKNAPIWIQKAIVKHEKLANPT